MTSGAMLYQLSYEALLGVGEEGGQYMSSLYEVSYPCIIYEYLYHLLHFRPRMPKAAGQER